MLNGVIKGGGHHRACAPKRRFPGRVFHLVGFPPIRYGLLPLARDRSRGSVRAVPPANGTGDSHPEHGEALPSTPNPDAPVPPIEPAPATAAELSTDLGQISADRAVQDRAVGEASESATGGQTAAAAGAEQQKLKQQQHPEQGSSSNASSSASQPPVQPPAPASQPAVPAAVPVNHLCQPASVRGAGSAEPSPLAPSAQSSAEGRTVDVGASSLPSSTTQNGQMSTHHVNGNRTHPPAQAQTQPQASAQTQPQTQPQTQAPAQTPTQAPTQTQPQAPAQTQAQAPAQTQGGTSGLCYDDGDDQILLVQEGTVPAPAPFPAPAPAPASAPVSTTDGVSHSSSAQPAPHIANAQSTVEPTPIAQPPVAPRPSAATPEPSVPSPQPAAAPTSAAQLPASSHPTTPQTQSAPQPPTATQPPAGPTPIAHPPAAPQPSAATPEPAAAPNSAAQPPASSQPTTPQSNQSPTATQRTAEPTPIAQAALAAPQPSAATHATSPASTSAAETPATSPVATYAVTQPVTKDTTPATQPVSGQATPTLQPASEQVPPVPQPVPNNTTPASQPDSDQAPPVPQPVRNNTTPASQPASDQAPYATQPVPNNTTPASHPASEQAPPVPQPVPNNTPASQPDFDQAPSATQPVPNNIAPASQPASERAPPIPQPVSEQATPECLWTSISREQAPQVPRPVPNNTTPVAQLASEQATPECLWTNISREQVPPATRPAKKNTTLVTQPVPQQPMLGAQPAAPQEEYESLCDDAPPCVVSCEDEGGTIRSGKDFKWTADQIPSSRLLSALMGGLVRGLNYRWMRLLDVGRRYVKAMDRWYTRTALYLSIVFGLLSAILSFVVVPLVNMEAIPNLQGVAERVTQRKVRLGKMKSVSLLGLSGMVPLISVGPLEVGPGPVEKSHLAMNELAVFLDPVQSAIHKQIMLQIHLEGPDVSLQQGNTFGWAGFPDDTVPSSRDLVPGLSSMAQEGPGGISAAPPSTPRPPGPGSGRPTPSSTPRSSSFGKQSVPLHDLLLFVRPTPHRNPAATFATTLLTQPVILAKNVYHGAEPVEAGHAVSLPSSQAWLNAGAGSSALLDPLRDILRKAATSACHSLSLPLPTTLVPAALRPSSEAGRAQDAGASCSATMIFSLLQKTHRNRKSTEAVPAKSTAVAKAVPTASPNNPEARTSASAASATTVTASATPGTSLMPRFNSTGKPSASSTFPAHQPYSGLHQRYQDFIRILAAKAAYTSPATSSASSSLDPRSKMITMSDIEISPATALSSSSSSSSSIPSTSTVTNRLSNQHLSEASRTHTPNHLPLSLLSTFRSGMTFLPSSSSSSSSPSSNPSPSHEDEHAQDGGGDGGGGLGAAPVGLVRVCIHNGRLRYTTFADPYARYLEGLNGVVRLGPGYDWVEINMEGGLHERDPRSYRCTSGSADSKRHLRHVTPGGFNNGRLRRFACDDLPTEVMNALTTYDRLPAAAPSSSQPSPPEPASSSSSSMNVLDSNTDAGDIGSSKWNSLPWSSSLPKSPQSPQTPGLGHYQSQHPQQSHHHHHQSQQPHQSHHHHQSQLPTGQAPAAQPHQQWRTAQQQWLQQQTPQQRQSALPGELGSNGVALAWQTPGASAAAGGAAATAAAAGSRLSLGGGDQSPGVSAGGGGGGGGLSLGGGGGGLFLGGDEQSPGVAGGMLPHASSGLAERASKGLMAVVKTVQRPVWDEHTRELKETVSLTGHGELLASNTDTGQVAPWDLREELEDWAGGSATVLDDQMWIEEEEEQALWKESTVGQPTGGRLNFRLVMTNISGSEATEWPQLEATVRGTNLHLPNLEQCLEIPMDLFSGRADGEIKIVSRDEATWGFPELYGLVHCKDVDLHFWDSPDDITKANMDLIFERDRMYLHGAQGYFGAAPLRLTGDMDLNPDGGSYRLSADIPGVEVNALRATLATRPLPMPLAGALRGIMHITGPIEHPVFSGTAVLVRPTPEMLEGCEVTPALIKMLADPQTVGGYDQVPIASASGVFSMDTATDMFTLHSAQVQPVGCGSVICSGDMWLAAQAENDPRAINLHGEGISIDADRIARCYLPPGMQLPPSLLQLGKANLSLTMAGSHLAPKVATRFDLKDSEVSGTCSLSPDAIRIKAQGPVLSVDGAILVSTPLEPLARAANTQAEATLYSKPRFEGCDIDLVLKGADLLGMVSPGFLVDGLSGGQSLRGRVGGNVSLRLRPVPRGSKPLGSGSGGADAGRRRVLQGRSSPEDTIFEGSVSLSGLKINQLELARSLSGTASLSNQKLYVHAKRAHTPSKSSSQSSTTGSTGAGSSMGSMGLQEMLDVEFSVPGLADALNLERLADDDGALPAPPNAPSYAAVQTGNQRGSEPYLSQQHDERYPDEGDSTGDSRFLLRRGDLMLRSDMYSGGDEVHMKVENLQLDDLEIGSLRGKLVSAELDALEGGRKGLAAVQLEGLRFASLQAHGFKSSVRWEGDILKLEESVLSQGSSRYEFSGEMYVPGLQAAAAALPDTGGLAALTAAVAGPQLPDASAPSGRGPPELQASGSGPGGGGASAPGGGPDPEAGKKKAAEEQSARSNTRWRMQVSVPGAQVQDMLPAAQLMSSSRSVGHSYLMAAKGSFASMLEEAAVSVDSLRTIVDQLPRPSANPENDAQGAAATRGKSRNGHMPGLQDLQGEWKGRIQAFGDAEGATSVDFDLKGEDWKWGQYQVDSLVAIGSADMNDGVLLDELSMAAGPARLHAQGSLMCPQQEASLRVTDFPLDLLQPLYSALPALQSATAAAAAQSHDRARSNYLRTRITSFSKMLESKFGLKLVSGQSSLPGTLPASPLSGLLFMDGKLCGSKAAPEAVLDVRVDEGALGSTRLAQAQAHATLDSRQRLELSMEVMPLEHTGYLRLQGHAGIQPPPSNQLPAPSLTSANLANLDHRTAGSNLRAPSPQPQPTGSGSARDVAYSGSQKGNKPIQDGDPAPARTDSSASLAAAEPVDIGDDVAAPASPQLPSRGSQELAEAGEKLVEAEEQLSLKLSVCDGGMAMFSALVPDVEWQGGHAQVDMHLHGDLQSPALDGNVELSRATLYSPMLRYPVTGLGASIQVGGDLLSVKHLEAKVGRQGTFTVKGALPIQQSGSSEVMEMKGGKEAGKEGLPVGKITIDASGLELRVRNMYTGMLDMSTALENSVLKPAASGWLRFSNGTLFLLPQGGTNAGVVAGPTPGDGKDPSDTATNRAERDVVGTAFSLLKAGRKRSILGAMSPVGSLESMFESGALGGVSLPSGPPISDGLHLKGVDIRLGPDFRAFFPVVLNMQLSGQVQLNGPADPDLLTASGAVKLEGGELNLVATQFSLDRGHVNQIVFMPESKVSDPLIDVVLVSGDLRATVQGQGGSWQDGLLLTASGTPLGSSSGAGPAAGGKGGQGRGGDTSVGGATMEPTEVARVFEERVAEALLGENGQLALHSLASSTFSTLLPKIETRGQLGAARWRLVGAPSLPNLLGALDPLSADGGGQSGLDAYKFLSGLAVGTELELEWGNCLEAAFSHKLQDSDIGTEATLTYKIGDFIRLQFQISRLTKPSLLLKYSSEGTHGGR